MQRPDGLGVTPTALIQGRYRGWRKADDTPAGQLEAVINGVRQRLPRYRHEPMRSWTPYVL